MCGMKLDIGTIWRKERNQPEGGKGMKEGGGGVS